jgi:hypothetical protein
LLRNASGAEMRIILCYNTALTALMPNIDEDARAARLASARKTLASKAVRCEGAGIDSSAWPATARSCQRHPGPLSCGKSDL